MSTLVNLVLAVVLNFYSTGNMQHTKTVASQLNKTSIENCKVYQVKDLRSNYVITESEFIKSSIGIN